MASDFRKYRQLIWAFARTDFKLRYHGSILGYVWSLLQPLMIFTIMYFVFSSVFARGGGNEYYALELITGLMVFTYFSEGTMSGMKSLLGKKSIIKKIYMPLWVIISASVTHASITFFLNVFVIIIFFAANQFLPTIPGVLYFLLSCIEMGMLMVAFSFIAAPLYVRLRDLQMIWQVVTRALLYASPIIYPLSIMPERMQKIILLNPIAFIIHFMKEALIYHRLPEPWQAITFFCIVLAMMLASFVIFRKFSQRTVEYL